MLNKIGLLSSLLISTLLVACGSGGRDSSADNTSNTGADNTSNTGNTDGGTEKQKNPLANGGIPTEKAVIYAGLDADSDWTLTFDPKNKSGIYKITDGEDYIIKKGDYDPTSGDMTFRSCETNTDDACDEFETYGLNVSELNLQGDGLVLLGEYPHAYWGYMPTEASNMPSGIVEYNGDFLANYWYNDDSSDVDVDVNGTAKTTVDFNAGRLDADFGGIDGQYSQFTMHLEDAEIDGVRFSGGTITGTDHEGREFVADDSADAVSGRFFGKNGEELGGVINLLTDVELENDDPDVFGDASGSLYVDGAWNGVRE